MLRILVLAVLLASCIEPATPHCGTLTCPADKVCAAGRHECVLPGQVTACTGAADGTACTFPGETDGVCDAGVCFTSECGDGLVGETEVCDDKNSVDGDGCSAGCLSDERCGNGIVDVAIGESCDDHNLQSGDGCSSGCTAEVASWHEVDLDPYPGAYGAEATYDSARGRIVMFGGVSPTGVRVHETFEHDGAQWERVLRGELPPGREGHVLAYDPVRRRTVLFGGQSGTSTMPQFLDDVWTYDGAWHAQAVAGGPSPRGGAAGAFDAATGSLVVFGGETSGGAVAETWELAGGTWTQRAVAGPSARRDHRMAYDAQRARIVLVGGRSGTTQLDDTWEWNGVAWQQVTTATTIPTARGAIGYHAGRRRVVLASGLDAITATTWEFDGIDWVQQSGTSPTARRRAAMAYDPVARALVLRGGTDKPPNMGGPPFDDTWRYDGAWTLDASVEPHAPPPRNFAGFAFDPVRQRFVLAAGVTPPNVHGADTWSYDGAQWMLRATEPALGACGPMGQCTAVMAWDPIGQRMLLVRGNGMTTETWSFDGRQWKRLVTTGGPPGRDTFSLAYDTDRNRLVLFGGAMMMNVASDTWELGGTTWTQVPTAMAPPARAEGAMVFDPARHAMVLFGGRGIGNALLDDTWLYNGTAWTRLDPTHHPPARTGAGMTFHIARDGAILFGGDGAMGPYNDTWELHDSDWTQLNVFEGPAPRRSPHLAYDPARKLVVLFGGDPTSDTWELLYRSTRGDEVCEATGDEDQDGVADCGDPDCALAICGAPDHVCRAGVCACVGTGEVRCDDGFDDDCDGSVDCADTECTATPLCTGEANCANAVDDDGDGKIDCADPGCAGTGACQRFETACADGLDNDADGKPDCADIDCFLAGCAEVTP